MAYVRGTQPAAGSHTPVWQGPLQSVRPPGLQVPARHLSPAAQVVWHGTGDRQLDGVGHGLLRVFGPHGVVRRLGWPVHMRCPRGFDFTPAPTARTSYALRSFWTCSALVGRWSPRCGRGRRRTTRPLTVLPQGWMPNLAAGPSEIPSDLSADILVINHSALIQAVKSQWRFQ